MRFAAPKILKPLLLAVLAGSVLAGCASRGGAPATAEPSQAADTHPSLFNAPYLVKGSGKHRLKSQWLKKISGDEDLQLVFRPSGSISSKTISALHPVYAEA